jgi:hypothetical protein
VHSPREKQAVRKPRFGKDWLEEVTHLFKWRSAQIPVNDTIQKWDIHRFLL